MPAAARVALFEDDPQLQQLLSIILHAEGCEVRAEQDGGSARAVTAAFRPDLAIVDVTLGDDVNGFDVARDVRAVDGSVPIMFLTGADSLEHRLEGFSLGADDYMVKPFAVAELVARVHALLRRAGRGSWNGAVASFADVTVDSAGHVVTRAGAPVELTPTEYELLRVFLRRPRVVLGKTDLLREVWGYSGFDANLVEVHVSSLRRKLEAHGPRVIHTVRSVGYVLREALLSTG